MHDAVSAANPFGAKALMPPSPAPSAPSAAAAPIGLSQYDAALSGETSPVSLALPECLSFEDWRMIGERLCLLHQGIGFWIGDWWAHGEHHYGERSTVMAQGLFGHSLKSLRNAASVARAIERSRRRERLSFTHHAEVAVLPPERGDALLDRAVQEGISVRALRALVRSEQGAAPAPAMATDHEALLDSLRQRVRRQVAAHGKRIVLEVLDRLRREVEFDRIPLPSRRPGPRPHGLPGGNVAGTQGPAADL